LYLINRTGTTSVALDINGAQFKAASVAPFALTTDKFTALTCGGGGSYSNRQISCWGLGGGLTSGNRTAIYNRLSAYMGGIGLLVEVWAAAVVAAGGSVSGTLTSGRKKLINDLIMGLMADGVWSKLDRLWLFAAENSQSALIDIKGAVSATAVNTPTSRQPWLCLQWLEQLHRHRGQSCSRGLQLCPG
jgi:hypothetical protein